MAKFFNIFRYLKTTWMVLLDKRTPKTAKLVTVGALVYLISPADLVPDVVPVLCWFDDFGLLALAFKMLPADVYAAVRAKMEGLPVDDYENVAPGELAGDKALPNYLREQ